MQPIIAEESRCYKLALTNVLLDIVLENLHDSFVAHGLLLWDICCLL